MNEKNNKYEKRLQFQQKIISRQSGQIDSLNLEIEKLKNQLIEKDKIINSIEPMRKEMMETINEQKRLKKEYNKLINELKSMKSIINKELYKGKWWLIKLLLK